MSAAEIRADIVEAFQIAARGYEQLCIGRNDIAPRCHEQAASLRAKAHEIEARFFLAPRHGVLTPIPADKHPTQEAA